MRVPHLGFRARIVVLASLICVAAISYPLVYPAHATVFTIPESMLLDTTNFPKGWGPAAVTRADAPGPSVDFTFTGLTSGGTGVKDDYSVSLVYGQAGGVHNADFTNLSGYAIRVENRSGGPIWVQNFINTGFTDGGVNWQHDTFWCCNPNWRYIGSGEAVALYLNFDSAVAYNIGDNPVPHTGGGLGWPGGSAYQINTTDRTEVTAIGFEVADFGTNPNATVRVTPLVLNLTLSTTYVDDDWVGAPPGKEVYFPGDPNPHYIGFDAFATVQAGINAVTATGTVRVAAGSYHESLSIGKSVTLTGDPGSSTVAGPGPNAPVLDGTGFSAIPAISIDLGTSNVIIEGFEIRNYGPTGNTNADGVSTWNAGTSNITVRDNYMHDLGYAGVLTGNGWGGPQGVHDNWQVVYNTVQTTGAYAFDMENVKNSAVSHNVISGIPSYVINVIGVATEPGANITTENVRVEYNAITGCADRNINLQAWTDGGADRTATVRNVTVANNAISGVFNLVIAWKMGPGTNVVSDLVIDGNTLTVSNPKGAEYTVNLADVAGISSFSGNTLTLSGAVGGGGTFFHGLNIVGPSTGAWNIAENVLSGGGVGTASVGVRVRGTVPSSAVLNLADNLIAGWDKGIKSDALPSGATVSASWNAIMGNTTAGLENGPGAVISAQRNWWGAVSGPYNLASNPGGTGNQVSNNVLFDPWIGKAGGENIVCDPDPEYLNRTNPTKTVAVKYLGGGGGLVYGYSVSFSWDASKVTMGGVTQGTLLSSQGTTYFYASGTGNTRTVDCVLMGPYPGVTGPGTMFTVSFTGIASGTSPIDITVVAVRDKNNAALSGFYENDGELVVDIVDPVVTGVFIDNRTLPHTDAYIKNGQTARITATVTDDIGIATIRANLTGLGGLGSVAPDSIVGTVAYWNLASVVCTPSDAVVTVTVTATDLRGNVGTGSDTIIADNTPPLAISNLAAAQQKSGNDADGTTKIALTFTAAGDAYAVEVYRAGFGNYPEYSDPPGGVVRGTPGYVPGSPWAITGVVASGQKDEPTARDFWYYVAFVKDIAWNVSAISNETGGALNYHLGDVTNGASPGTGDNLVNTADFSSLSGTYWKGHGEGGYLNYCDVGPTTDYSTNALPTTDNVVDFEDLMMFAMNFTTVSFAPDNSAVRFENPSVNLVVDGASGGVVRAHVMLEGNRQNVKGLHAALSYNPAALEYVGVTQGSLVVGQTSPVFFEDLGGAGKVQVDLAAMLSTSTIRGSGEVAVVEFRVIGTGNTIPTLSAADLRDKANRALGKRVEPRQDDTLVSDGATMAVTFGAYPNPFKGTTEIAFSVPVASEVSLKVYDVNGRLVRSLVEGSLAAGSHRVVWDGRTGAGSQTAPGVYLAVVKIGDSETASKMFLLP